MKTIYLLGWAVNAVLLSIFWPSVEWIFIHILNVFIPCGLLVVRMFMLHAEGKEIDKNLPV